MAGNKNSGRRPNRPQVIRQKMFSILKENDDAKLNAILEKAVELAMSGDVQMIKEVFDRLDGKPKQAVSGDEEQPIIHKIVREFVDSHRGAYGNG